MTLSVISGDQQRSFVVIVVYSCEEELPKKEEKRTLQVR